MADVLGAIPADQTEVRARLQKIVRDAGFMAPELLPDLWWEADLWWEVSVVMRDLCADCYNNPPCKITGWVKQVCRLITAEGTEHEHPKRKRLREEGKL
jgi:hypothetical protein